MPEPESCRLGIEARVDAPARGGYLPPYWVAASEWGSGKSLKLGRTCPPRALDGPEKGRGCAELRQRKSRLLSWEGIRGAARDRRGPRATPAALGTPPERARLLRLQAAKLKVAMRDRAARIARPRDGS